MIDVVLRDDGGGEEDRLRGDGGKEEDRGGRVARGGGGGAVRGGANGFGLVCLHACGDLVPNMIMAFAGDDKCRALFAVSCCYMKVSWQILNPNPETRNPLNPKPETRNLPNPKPETRNFQTRNPKPPKSSTPCGDLLLYEGVVLGCSASRKTRARGCGRHRGVSNEPIRKVPVVICKVPVVMISPCGNL